MKRLLAVNPLSKYARDQEKREILMGYELKSQVIIFATNNINKFNEVRGVLSEYELSVGMLRVKCVEIQGDTLEEIAEESVKDTFRRCSLPVLVEDAGLFIDSLHGFPGPYSAYVYRTIGNVGLLKLLKNINDRKARFKSVVAFFSPELNSPILFDGVVEGIITMEQRKVNSQCGFGFDPIFVPADNNKTFAEMNMKEKNKLSHRATSFRKFAEWYKNLPTKNDPP
jgi:XTP/dITP diphosphohydrolase